jgi:hypothetical protein
VLAPEPEIKNVQRRYRPGTLVLETEYYTDNGAVRVIDFMPPRTRTPELIRIIEGMSRHVPMAMDLGIRFDYGSVVPWVRRSEDGIRATAGPETLHLRTRARLTGQGLRTVAHFSVAAGERVPFELAWSPTHENAPPPTDPEQSLQETEEWWMSWSGRCTFHGEWHGRLRQYVSDLVALAERGFASPIAFDTENHLAFMALAFAGKQVVHARSILTLEGSMDATLVARSMFEGLSQLLWAAQSPDDRPLRWRTFAFVRDWRQMRKKRAQRVGVSEDRNEFIEDGLKNTVTCFESQG